MADPQTPTTPMGGGPVVLFPSGHKVQMPAELSGDDLHTASAAIWNSLKSSASTLGEEAKAAGKAVSELPGSLYHAAADPESEEEAQRYGKGFESSIGPTGRFLDRTVVQPTDYAAHCYADALSGKKAPVGAGSGDRAAIESSILDAAPEAVGSGAMAILAGRLFHGGKALMPQEEPATTLSGEELKARLKQIGDGRTPTKVGEGVNRNISVEDARRRLGLEGVKAGAEAKNSEFVNQHADLLKGKPRAELKPGADKAGLPSSTLNPGDKMVKAATADKYLKLIGSDEDSILKTPKDKASVQYFRDQIKQGKSLGPVELRIDDKGNILEADGRHRALASHLESKPVDIIVRKTPLSGMKGQTQ